MKNEINSLKGAWKFLKYSIRNIFSIRNVAKKVVYGLMRDEWEKCMFGWTIRSEEYTVRVWKKK